MTNRTGQNFNPSNASSEIHRVERQVQSSRRKHIGSMLALGIATIAFFAVVGLVSFDNLPTVVVGLIMFFPFMFYLVLENIRKSNPPASGKKLMILETRLARVYVSLMLGSLAIDLFLLQPYQGTIWAALTGILPALPCFYGAWKVSRK